MDNQNFKCKTCGAPLDGLVAESTNGVVECPYCFNVWTIPKKEIVPDALQFLRIGEHELDTCKFDDAYEAYKKASELDTKEPEAYFGMALAEFKIQYLKVEPTKEDEKPHLQPICHEVTEKKFSDSPNFLKALRFATNEQREEYEKYGAEIDYILGEFFKLKKEGLDYDCFICVKVTDGESKQFTEDSKDADYIYRLLQDKGFKPFYSERELRNVTGADYEARILYALFTSECMLVVCRNESYLQTPWVKNEYTRFLKLVNDEEKESDSITIVFNGKAIERLPGRKGKLQGIDFEKRSADGQIIEFVESHTPEAKKKREEEKARKEAEGNVIRSEIEEQKRAIAEQRRAMEEQQHALEKQLEKLKATFTAGSVSGTLSEDEPLERIESKRQKAERIARDFYIEGTLLKRLKSSAEHVRIPQGITSIGEKAFQDCGNLTSVTIPNSVTSICDSAFCNCSRLTEITIPNSVTSICDSAFCNCSSLINIIIGDDVTSICDSAFCNCSRLTEITIPNSVTSIGNYAFHNCSNLISITIGDGVTSIGKNAFSSCSNLTSISIPDSVTSIGERAFSGCDNLTSVIIPDSVTSIGERAFSGCNNLTSVIIPDSVTSIGKDVFGGCSNIPTIYCMSKKKGKKWHKYWNVIWHNIYAKKRAKVVWDYKGK